MSVFRILEFGSDSTMLVVGLLDLLDLIHVLFNLMERVFNGISHEFVDILDTVTSLQDIVELVSKLLCPGSSMTTTSWKITDSDMFSEVSNPSFNRESESSEVWAFSDVTNGSLS